MGQSSQKKKATAKENAAARMAERSDSGGGKSPTVPASEKQRSQGRFPGETPLTGEDRPATTAGPKVKGQIPQDTKRKR